MNYRLSFLFILMLFACDNKKEPVEKITAFINATIIDGSGGDPMKESTILVKDGKILGMGIKGSVTIPEHATVVDLAGKTVIPGIINAHGHVGDVKGIEGGNYSKQNIVDNLSIYARYGVTTVVSLGGDKEEAESLRSINDTTKIQRARLFIAGEVINGKTPDEAKAVVDKNHLMGVDFMKIRVDDNLGTAQKMPEDIYRTVISRSHELGYKIATHMYYLDDATKLLNAGTDFLAHSVRDKPVDQAFIRLIREKKAGYCATLTRELSTFVYADTAAFFKDPFFLKEYGNVFKPLEDPAFQVNMRNSTSGATYKKQLPIAMANLKSLSDNGVPIVFGTDSGIPTRFMGYFEHLEMSMMAEAGLTPMQIIVSFSKTPAEYLGLKNVGVINVGNHADFIVLNSDPLKDIKNVRDIDAVYVGGERIER